MLHCNVNVIQVLLEHGAKKDSKNEDGLIPEELISPNHPEIKNLFQ